MTLLNRPMRKTYQLLPRYLVFIILLSFFEHNARAQVDLTPPDFDSCSQTECKFNQTVGRSTSLTSGLTNSIGVSASTQSATSTINASAYGQVQLDGSASNNVTQSIGNVLDTSSSPIKVTFNSDLNASLTESAVDRSTSSGGTSTSANGTTEDATNNSSQAVFESQGFGSLQNLTYLGTAPSTGLTSSDSENSETGTKFSAEVNNEGAVKEAGSGQANAGANSTTSFNTSITDNNFVSAFITSF